MKDPNRVGAMANLIRAAAISSAGEVGWAEKAAEIIDKYLQEEKPRIPEGYFKIGEDVEVYDSEEKEWKRGSVIGKSVDGLTRYSSSSVRRISAWKPKDGDKVLVEFADTNRTVYAIAASDCEIYSWDKVTGEKKIVPSTMKPFNASKIGEPWSEI